eukprot:TRINITY_DN1497_c0_g1_i1.p1 TRINITY_DN1497_c0_g1~~TRINITY_DN1497_c0_g1_i1.p1  ORF type:complete len:329 (-),score=54.88 TRINITY_DN1497_c0_g1_i1:122-1108(-)
MTTDTTNTPTRIYRGVREFLLGGLATGGAAIFTNPIEVVKTRLQLQGELKKTSKQERVYKGVFDAMYTITKHEGISGIQKGLGPAILYQFAMNGVRLGLYEPLKKFFSRMYFKGVGNNTTINSNIDKAPPEPFLLKVLSGAIAGATGAAVGSPFYLVKTRFQSHSSYLPVGHQHQYRNTWHALSSIASEGGVKGLFRGVNAAVLRVCVGSAVQLSTYDQIKGHLIGYGLVQDNVVGHFSSSLLTGGAVVIAMNPFDVVATRMYNQKVEAGKGVLYSNVLDCCIKIFTTEKLLGFYKGCLAHYLRLGPHTILTFVFWEQLKRLANYHEL